jgi:hypothetical protein
VGLPVGNVVVVNSVVVDSVAWACRSRPRFADLGLDLPISACGGGFALPRSAWGGGFALGLGLCRGSPTQGLVHGAMGGGHMWRRRRRRDLGLFIEI